MHLLQTLKSDDMKFKTLLITPLFIFCVFGVMAQYQVGHQSFAFDDTSRSNRNVWGEVYYPADVAGDNVAISEGEFPLIVFGHGFLVTWTEYSVWWKELTAQGYIVAFPRTEGNISPNHATFAEDMSFIIDEYMAENNDTASPFYQHFSGKNAIMGHSMGGGSSYLSAGTYNANIETVVSMAAANTNPSSIDAAANITVPVLTIAGADDCVVQNGGKPLDIYNGLTNTSYKAYVEILGASHCNFGINSFFSSCGIGEFCSASIDKAEQHNQMFLSAIPWLDYMLKGDCNAWTTFQNHLTTSAAHTYQEAGALPLPTIELTASSYFCSNTSVTLTADLTGNYCDIEWSKDGNLIPGASNTTLTATSEGNYTATAINADGNTVTTDIELYKYQLLSHDNFETGYGNWNNGGLHCRRNINDAPYANSGDYCVRLRKRGFYSKVSSNVLDLTAYDEVRIDFSYYARGMDNPTEGFLLQMTTDGVNYTTVEEWNKSDEFQNEQRKYDSVIIPGPFTATTRFKFKGDANGLYDWVYLDNIKIFVCGEGNAATRLNTLAANPTEKDIDRKSTLSKSIGEVFPNPSKDQVSINLELEEEKDFDVFLTDLSGRLVYQSTETGTKGMQQLSIDISTLNNGYYVLVLQIGAERVTRKFIKSK